MFNMCKQAAIDGGVLVNTFDGIVVSMSGNVW